jgi:hypothetical protein
MKKILRNEMLLDRQSRSFGFKTTEAELPPSSICLVCNRLRAAGDVVVGSPTKTTPTPTSATLQKQTTSPTLWERFIQWWNN